MHRHGHAPWGVRLLEKAIPMISESGKGRGDPETERTRFRAKRQLAGAGKPKAVTSTSTSTWTSPVSVRGHGYGQLGESAAAAAYHSEVSTDRLIAMGLVHKLPPSPCRANCDRISPHSISDGGHMWCAPTATACRQLHQQECPTPKRHLYAPCQARPGIRHSIRPHDWHDETIQAFQPRVMSMSKALGRRWSLAWGGQTDIG